MEEEKKKQITISRWFNQHDSSDDGNCLHIPAIVCVNSFGEY